MDDEERKLQIKLAQLQADIQIWLTMCFGGIAVFLSMILVFFQNYLSTPESQSADRISNLASMVTCFIAMVGVTWISTNMMKDKRTEMDKL